jgi:hypothetical protein
MSSKQSTSTQETMDKFYRTAWAIYARLVAEAWVTLLAFKHDDATSLVYLDDKGYVCKIRIGSGSVRKGTWKEIGMVRRGW